MTPQVISTSAPFQVIVSLLDIQMEKRDGKKDKKRDDR